MAVEILTIQDLGHEKWDSFVKAHPNGSLYHTSSWHQVIEESYGYKTRYHVLLEPNGAIRAGIPTVFLWNIFLGRRIVSYPFSDYCDPLIYNPDDLNALLENLRQAKENFEIRSFNLLDDSYPGIRADDSFCNYRINLEANVEVIYARLHPTCIRRNLKRAAREGVTIRKGGSFSDLKRFYRLHLGTRKRLGLPSQPFPFFQNLWKTYQPDGNLALLLAEYRGRTIGSLLLIGFRTGGEAGTFGRNVMYYKYGASDSRYFRMGTNPALFWAAILLARESGYSILDLGRASGRDEKGLMDFKRHLGAESERLSYLSTSECYSGSGSSPSARLVSGFLRIAPGWVSGAAGRLLYRYLG